MPNDHLVYYNHLKSQFYGVDYTFRIPFLSLSRYLECLLKYLVFSAKKDLFFSIASMKIYAEKTASRNFSLNETQKRISFCVAPIIIIYHNSSFLMIRFYISDDITSLLIFSLEIYLVTII